MAERRDPVGATLRASAARGAASALTIAATFLGLAAITFIIGRLMPVDPVIAIVGDRASKEVYQQVYADLGLDKPLFVQFGIYLASILRGDFGQSIMTGRPVLEDLKQYFPATIELATTATAIGVVIGLPLGVTAAVRRGSAYDHLARVLGLFGYSVPVFWLGLIALLVFYARLGWLPGPGRLDIAYDDVVARTTGFLMLDSALEGRWDVARNAFAHLVLPSAVLGLHAVAYIARMTRSFMLEQLQQEYILTARVKGVSESAIVAKHAFRNIYVQVITVIALTYASLLEGSVLTETVFAWPGIGLYVTNSLFNADMNAVIGATVLVGATLVALNLFSDALYRRFDPRIP